MARATTLTMLLSSVLLGACAAPRAIDGALDVPADAVPVASVRPAASPHAPNWLSVAQLPDGAIRGSSERALLLEVTRGGDGAIASVESAPLELANLIVRVSAKGPRNVGVVLESSLDATLKLDLFVSPDGERFKYASSCPVIAGGSAYEMFAERVVAVAVARVRATDPGDMRCE
jgi:hypothetical protein